MSAPSRNERYPTVGLKIDKVGRQRGYTKGKDQLSIEVGEKTGVCRSTRSNGCNANAGSGHRAPISADTKLLLLMFRLGEG